MPLNHRSVAPAVLKMRTGQRRGRIDIRKGIRLLVSTELGSQNFAASTRAEVAAFRLVGFTWQARQCCSGALRHTPRPADQCAIIWTGSKISQRVHFLGGGAGSQLLFYSKTTFSDMWGYSSDFGGTRIFRTGGLWLRSENQVHGRVRRLRVRLTHGDLEVGPRHSESLGVWPDFRPMAS
jgi:hypothetical protein